MTINVSLRNAGVVRVTIGSIYEREQRHRLEHMGMCKSSFISVKNIKWGRPSEKIRKIACIFNTLETVWLDMAFANY